MDTLILAAGRGERMRPLTDHTPKPLLEVGGSSLIERQIRRLVAAGYVRLVINLGYLGSRIAEQLGDGGRYGARITYSPEPPGALDTGGGIVRALAHLRGEVFTVANADLWTDFDYTRLPTCLPGAAWLVLVDNPPHHSEGDFDLDGNRVRPLSSSSRHRLTFAGIGVYRRDLFAGRADGRYPLLPILMDAVRAGDVEAVHYQGAWTDVGTPERLAALRTSIGA